MTLFADSVGGGGMDGSGGGWVEQWRRPLSLPLSISPFSQWILSGKDEKGKEEEGRNCQKRYTFPNMRFPTSCVDLVMGIVCIAPSTDNKYFILFFLVFSCLFQVTPTSTTAT